MNLLITLSLIVCYLVVIYFLCEVINQGMVIRQAQWLQISKSIRLREELMDYSFAQSGASNFIETSEKDVAFSFYNTLQIIIPKSSTNTIFK